MKIKVSNPMLKVVKDICKELSCVDSVHLCKASERTYMMQALPLAFHNDWETIDMDMANDGQYKYIQIVYNDDCYAMPRNITTPELLHQFKHNKVVDFDGLKAMLKEMIEI